MKGLVQSVRKIIVWSVCAVLALALLAVLLLQLPVVQSKLVHLAASYLSEQTGTHISVGSVAIRFPRSVVIEEVFADDLNKDTLLYVEELSVGIHMLSLLNNKLEISELSLKGVNAHILRTASDSSFNFAFLTKLFAGKSQPEIPQPKDTTGKPLVFDITQVNLQNIRGSFVDEVSGLSIKGLIGELALSPKTINLQPMDFAIHQLTLKETAVWLDISQLRSAPDTITDTIPTVLPGLGAERLTLHNVKFYLNKPTDSLYLFSEVTDLDILPTRIDLNKQLIAVTKVNIHGSKTGLILIPEAPNPQPSTPSTPSTQNWHIDIASGNLSDNAFTMDMKGGTKQPSGFDYKHIRIDGFALTATQLHYDPHKISGEIKKLQASEQCGLAVKQLQARFVYDDTHAELANLDLRTGNSRLSKYIRVDWKSLDDFSDHPENILVNCRFNNSKISMKDLVLLAPQLAQQQELKGREVALNGTVQGSTQQMELKQFSAQTNQVMVEATGTINQLLTPQKLSYQFPKIVVTGTRSGIESLLPKHTIPASISLPEQFLLTGSANGTTQSSIADVYLKSSDGELVLKGNMDFDKQHYDIHSQPTALNIGRILGLSEYLGTVSGTIDANGKQFDPQKMESDIRCNLTQTELYKHVYAAIDLEANIDPQMYSVNLNVNDTALKMKLIANANKVNSNLSGSMQSTITFADLYAMHISKQHVSGSAKINGKINPSSLNNLSASLDIQGVNVLKNGRKYKADTLLNLNLNNRLFAQNNKALIDVSYTGTTHLHSISGTLRKYIHQFTNQKDSLPDSLSESIVAEVQIKPNPILTEVFFPNITQFNGANLKVNYNAKLNSFYTTASVPLLEIDQTLIKGFDFEAKGHDNFFKCEASVQSCQRGSISFPKTSVNFTAANNNLDCELRMIHPDSGSRIWMKSNIQRVSTDEFTIALSHPYIILNNHKWMVNTDNQISIFPDRVSVNNLTLQYNQSKMSIASQDQTKASPFNISFNQFEIGTFSELIEKDSAIARGLMDGTVVLQTSPSFGFTSDLSIKQISINSVQMGDLSVKASNMGDNHFSVLGTLIGANNQLSAKLEVNPQNLDLDLDIKQLNVSTIEAFIPKTIRKSEGKIQGHLELTKRDDKLSYSGTFVCSQTSFNLSYINSRLYLQDENIRLDERGVYFDDFTIRDSMQQPMEINGSIFTPQSKPITYDLNIKTNQFRVLNTTAKHNPLYYGVLLLNSNINIKGDENLPIVTAQAKLIEGSNLTVVVQQGELNTDKGDGVVIFTDSNNQTLVGDTFQLASNIRGIDLTVNLEVNNKTSFTLITDKVSGDHLKVSGDALLSFGMDPSGQMSLTGSYELSKGNYYVSFQKIVKRDFEIKKGSTIVWSGDPLDAQMDITATYKVKTGATDLLAAELAGMSQAERNAYRKLMNYDVNLMMRGFLLKPQLNFKLDMPAKDQQAFNGLVYAKINYINSDVNELNKQVFSLLIMGRFLPVGMSSNTSTTDAVSAVARNSVNQMLSDQMNAISGKYVKGAELNFNLQSNDDYTAQGTQQNTELQIGLKKEMFNNRVSVQVGSNIDVDGSKTAATGQNITGDLVMEYKITEDGRYRFKAFRENNYEGVIDGLIYRTGIGLAFTRNFDSLSQLFKAPPAINDSLQSDSLPSE